MKLRLMTKATLFIVSFILGLAFAACHNEPKTNLEKIDSLKKQVQADANTLQNLEAKEYKSLEKDFRACDSMLQYLSPEQVDESFEKLRLVQAYLEQFKITKPMMQADIDSTLRQLDRLRADAESNYIKDSLVTVYIANETEFVDRLSNQVRYFKDRFGTCQKDLAALKKQK